MQFSDASSEFQDNKNSCEVVWTQIIVLQIFVFQHNHDENFHEIIRQPKNCWTFEMSTNMVENHSKIISKFQIHIGILIENSYLG
jgi:hypothetical protein